MHVTTQRAEFPVMALWPRAHSATFPSLRSGEQLYMSSLVWRHVAL